MASRPVSDPVLRLLDTFEARVRAAFMTAIADIRDTATIQAIVSRLERGDVIGAVEALRIEPEAFSRLELALADAYNGGGQAMVGALPVLRDGDSRVVLRWGVRNTAGEAWLRDYSSRLITRIVEDQREAIRAALTEGLMQGLNPRVSALNVIGRLSRATGQREGGIIGLTAPQERFVSNARAELTSGDPARMRDYLERGRRDKRFDRAITAAIRDGKSLDAKTIEQAISRYADRLLQLRGDTIGLNETLNAMARARYDAVAQQIVSGKIDAMDVRKVWKHTPQENPRLHHVAMNGKSVRWDEQFTLPNGVSMDFPHDPTAPISETAGCKCIFLFKIDYFAPIVRRERGRRAA